MPRSALEIARGALIKKAIETYGQARSLLFTMESLLVPASVYWATKKRPRLPWDNPELFVTARAELRKLLEIDADNIARGVYPIEVLKPENLFEHLKRLPKIVEDSVSAAKRRDKKVTKAFSESAKALTKDLPEYYQRNFHFQRDGYLSERSAELYDHQVEILFAGSADAMRRQILPPLVEKLRDLKKPRILELGCGSGTATRFLSLALPRAEIWAVDLSTPYIEAARERGLPNTSFLAADATDLSSCPDLESGGFDAIVSVFLFHELPEKERVKVFAEAARFLKPGGLLVVADSLQLGDRPRLDGSLRDFPVHFHEPFYANYIKRPLRRMVAKAGFVGIREETAFFNKVLSARKAKRK